MHGLVERVVEEYLRAADAAAPNLVEGLYLTGSIALGDFHPCSSDIDFVAVTAEPLEGAGLVALERMHAQLRNQRSRPCFDGIYVTWQDLGRAPSEVLPGAGSHDGEFRAGASEPPSPVVWHTVARYGVACRGPEPGKLGIVSNSEALAAWTDDNLDQYWARLLQDASRVRSRWGLASLTAYGTVWIVSGVSRLHYTLATGDLASKEAACRHALTAFPQWDRVVTEAVRLRRADRGRPTVAGSLVGLSDHLRVGRSGPRRSLYRTPFARRRDVLAFARAVIAAGHELYSRRSPGTAIV